MPASATSLRILPDLHANPASQALPNAAMPPKSDIPHYFGAPKGNEVQSKSVQRFCKDPDHACRVLHAEKLMKMPFARKSANAYQQNPDYTELTVL
ncbi:MAG: hypothetical protein ACI4NA_03680 [Succinivibrio sp.]